MKKVRKKIIILICLLVLSIPMISLPLMSQVKSDDDLFYTYLGPVAGISMNWISYSDWFDDSRETRDSTAYGFQGGVLLAVYVDRIIGDFRIFFQHNSGSDTSLYHLTMKSSGKYSWPMNENFSLTAGLGIYFETPPSNEDYQNGAGFFLPVGMYYDFNHTTRLVTDIYCSYGTYGLGEDSTKMSAGIEIGVIFKVGRM